MTATEDTTILHLLRLNREQLTYSSPGPQLPPHGRGRQCGEEYFGMMDLIYHVIQSLCPKSTC